MDSITNPWWLGGNICAGVPAGAEIATKLGARVWISAHDGEKEVRGLATGMLKTKRWKREEVEEALGPRAEMPKPNEEKLGHARNTSTGSGSGGVTTEVLRLGSGGEVIANGNGLLWYSLENKDEDQWAIGGTKPAPKIKVKDLDKAKPADSHIEKAPGGLKTRKSARGGLSVRFRSTLVT